MATGGKIDQGKYPDWSALLTLLPEARDGGGGVNRDGYGC